MKRILSVICVGAAAFGCDQSAGRRAAAPAAPASGTDWSTITAASDGSEIMTSKSIARQVDGWYRGSRNSIDLVYQPDGRATDDQGHSVAVPGTEWKGMVARARAASQSRPFVTSAAKSEFYASGPLKDDFGVVARYGYSLEAVDDSTLRFHNLGKYDDGR